MDPASSRSTADLLRDIVASVPQAQRLLDEDADRNVRHWREMVSTLQPSDTAKDLAAQLFVSPIRLAEFTVDLTVELQTAQRQQFDVSLNLFARPVHNFFLKRFGTQSVTTSAIELDCRATSAPPVEDAVPDQS